MVIYDFICGLRTLESFKMFPVNRYKNSRKQNELRISLLHVFVSHNMIIAETSTYKQSTIRNNAGLSQLLMFNCQQQAFL